MVRKALGSAVSPRSGGDPIVHLPTGTVTFLFTAIEGSTRKLGQHPNDYGEILDRHRQLIRAAIANEGGIEVATSGDALLPGSSFVGLGLDRSQRMKGVPS